MLICNHCKKIYNQGSKFCTFCGTPLEEAADNAYQKSHENQEAVRCEPASIRKDQAAGSLYPPVAEAGGKTYLSTAATNPAGMSVGARTKSGTAEVIGMFLVNCIPILGFPPAFIWASLKFRSMKIKLTALATGFIVLNIVITLFGYASMIALMKNSLADAVEQQYILTDFQQQGQKRIPAAGNTAGDQADILTEIPGIGSIPVQGITGIDDDQGDLQMILDFPVDGALVDATDTDSDQLLVPEDIQMPKTDKDGNTYFDSNEDGKYDMFMDKEGNTHMDSDGDGTYDMIFGQENGDG